MKKIIFVFLIIFSITLISACGKSEKTDKNSSETLAEEFFGDKTTEEWKAYYSEEINIDVDGNGVLDWQETTMTITYASDFYDDDNDLNTLFRNAMKWADQYPNITLVRDERFKKSVTNDDDNYLLELLTVASQENTMPDIYYSPLSAEVYDQDLTLDLTPYLRTDEEARFITNNSFEFMTSFDGQEIWGVPYMSVSQFPVVNVGLLREKNVQIPTYNWTYQNYEDLRSTVGTITNSGLCVFPGIIDFSDHGPNYFDAVANGWKGFNIKTQRFDYSSSENFGSWLSEEASEADKGWHFYDLEVAQQESICGSYGWPWGDGFQAIDNMWFFNLSTDINNLVKTRELDIDIYPMPQAPDGGITSLHGYYDTFSLSYKLSEDRVKAQAVYDLTKWLTYGENGTEARWDLIDDDVETYGWTVEDWILAGNTEETFPSIHPSTHLMDYIMGWPVTTNPNVLENHPLVKGFSSESPFSVYNFEAFKNVEFQRQLSGPVAYPRHIPAAISAMGDLNVWVDIKDRIKNEGYGYESLAPEIDELLNAALDDYLRYYTK